MLAFPLEFSFLPFVVVFAFCFDFFHFRFNRVFVLGFDLGVDYVMLVAFFFVVVDGVDYVMLVAFFFVVVDDR